MRALIAAIWFAVALTHLWRLWRTTEPLEKRRWSVALVVLALIAAATSVASGIKNGWGW